MAGTDAIRDQNRVTVALGQDNSNASVTLPFLIDHVTGRVLVDASGGTGQVLTPTGTVNGSNATFTVPANTVITSIVVDGLERYAGFGYTYISASGTITVDPLAPPTEYIRVNTAGVSAAGQVQSIVAGANVTVNNADPANPIVSATASGGGLTGTTGQYKTFVTVGRSNSDFNTSDYASDDLAVQAALNSLPIPATDGGTGGGIVFVKGDINPYVIKNQVVISEGQSLIGAGDQATVFQAKNGLNAYMFSTGTTSNSHRRNIYMANFKIDGNSANNSSGGGIYTYNLRNSKFYNIWVTNHQEYAFFLDGDSAIGYFNYVDSCQIDNGVAGIQTRFSEHNWFVKNEMSFLTGKGLYLQSDLDFVLDNQLDHIGDYEIHCYFGAGIWTICRNSIDRPQSDGIVIEGADKCIVSENYFDSQPAGKAAVKNVGSNQLMVINNRMTQSGGAGSFGILETSATDKCMYTNNMITGPATAISLNGSSTNVIRNNNQGD